MTFTTANEIYCEADDLSTAYKVVIRQNDFVDVGYIKRVMEDINNFEHNINHPLNEIEIVGKSIDERAIEFLKVISEDNKMFEGMRFIPLSNVQ